MVFNLKKKAIAPLNPIPQSNTPTNAPVPPQQDPNVMFVYQFLQGKFNSPQALLDEYGLAEVKRMASEMNSKNLGNAQDTAKQLEQAKQQMQTALPEAQLMNPAPTASSKNKIIVSSSEKKGNKMVKPFNLKKAQSPVAPVAPVPGSSDDLNDSPELIADPM